MDVPLEILMEKIVVGDTTNEIPQKFYNLINSLNIKDQEYLYVILKKIIEYKGA